MTAPVPLRVCPAVRWQVIPCDMSRESIPTIKEGRQTGEVSCELVHGPMSPKLNGFRRAIASHPCQYISDMYRPDIFVLENGLQVIAVERPFGKVFAAALTYGVGSFDDPSGTPGIAHFAEHLGFHGANKQLSETLGEFGAYVNAYTGYEHTEFRVFGHVDQARLALELLGNVVRNPAITEESVVTEREICLHEFSEGDDTSPREAAYDSFCRRMLGDPNWRIDHHKISRRRMKRLTTGRVNDFKRQHYAPSNARLAVVGPLDNARLQQLAKETICGDVTAPVSPAARPERYLAARAPVTFSIDRHAYVWIEIMQAARDVDAVTRLSADMIGHLVGGGPHSEMFRHLRAERSIAYITRANDYAYLNGTAVSFFCSVHRQNVQEALQFIIDRLKRIEEQGLTADEFENERVRMTRCHELSIDNPYGLASYLAYEALRSPAEALVRENEYITRLNSLTRSDVNRAASKLLSTSNRATFMGGRMGPFLRMRLRRKLRMSCT
jgi:zinc protease